MRVSVIIDQVTKEWNVGLLEDYVSPEDIPLIRSLTISSTHRRDTSVGPILRMASTQLNLDVG